MSTPRILVALALLIPACRPPGQAGSADAGQDGGELPADVDSAAGQGYLAVRSRGCAQCHQSPDPNDGVLSGQTAPVPGTGAYGSNLTPDPDTGMDAWDAGAIATSVLNATGGQGQALCPAMPAYADAGMGADEARAIAAYLQSLPPVWRAIPASGCSQVDASR